MTRPTDAATAAGCRGGRIEPQVARGDAGLPCATGRPTVILQASRTCQLVVSDRSGAVDWALALLPEQRGEGVAQAVGRLCLKVRHYEVGPPPKRG